MWRIKSLRQIGRIFIVVGILLCFYPTIAKMFVRENNCSEVGTVIGRIEIPKIDVSLVVYEGTDAKVLEVGVGHVVETGFPGKKDGHCILAGHRGLPRADLFLNLDKLELGDVFYIVRQEQLLVYEVCDIRVIKPEETSRLFTASDKDLVSLVTCTPYGINTHRLVVTGERLVKDK